MPEILLQDGVYKYEMPAMPTREEDILFYNYKKQDQFWRIPPRLDLRRANSSEKVDFINTERMRWLNGVWFFNNGVPTYITGMHYDHLVNMKFQFGHPKYFDEQRKEFYMRDLVRKDPNSYGVVWYKPRRYGMTSEEITNAVYVGMEDFNHNVGLMSNEGTKCITTLMRPIVDAIMNRPAYMRPKFYKPSGKKPRKAIEFHDGQVNFDEYDDTAEAVKELVGCLDGEIVPYNTTTAAMDGTKKKYIVMDEVWKWINASPYETLNINKKCVEDFGISGKISVLSTMGDSDDYAKAIEEGIKVWGESDPDIRDGNGRTTTGLYRYFVSAIHSKVLPADFTDKYGFVHEERAREFILNDRAKYAEGTKDYIYEVRRMPLDSEEALSTSESGTVFDTVAINKPLNSLIKLQAKMKPYVFGNLVEDTDERRTVYFDPDAYGIWKFDPKFLNTHEGLKNTNRYRLAYGGKIFPPKNPECHVGYDPVRYADSDSSSASKAALLAQQKFDYYGNNMAGRYIACALYRDKDPEHAHYEFIKICKFLSCMGSHERQVESVERVLKEQGAEELMTMYGAGDGKKHYGIWTDNNRRVLKTGVDLIQAQFIPDKITKIAPVEHIKFEEVLQARKGFQLDKRTTKRDMLMADIMLQHGLRDMKETNETDQTEDTQAIKNAMFAKASTAA